MVEHRSTLPLEPKTGPGLFSSPYLSKTFVAHFSAVAAVALYFKTTNTRNKDKLKQRFNKALKELNMIDDGRFELFVARKLKAWYYKFPPAVLHSCRVGEDEEEGPGGER